MSTGMVRHAGLACGPAAPASLLMLPPLAAAAAAAAALYPQASEAALAAATQEIDALKATVSAAPGAQEPLAE